MKLTKGKGYAAYLIGMGIVLLMGAVTSARLYPKLSLSINISNLINFYDPIGIAFVLVVCLISLLGTGLLRPFKDAVVCMFSKKKYDSARYERCLLAVKTTILAAFAAGFMICLISTVNAFKSMDLSGGASMFGTHISTGLLTPIYALVIVFVLLPVYVELKFRLSEKTEQSSTPSISVHVKSKKSR